MVNMTCDIVLGKFTDRKLMFTSSNNAALICAIQSEFVSTHPEEKPNDSECFHGIQNISMQSNLPYRWVHFEF